MRQDYTHVTILLDKSGSMGSCWKETVQSLNNLFNKQKLEDGKMTLSFYAFSDDVSTVYKFVDIKNINSIHNELQPFGMTALYKAFCTAVDDTGSELSQLRESNRPSKVLFVTFTDGGENASGSSYPLSLVQEKLKLQSEIYSWQFMFMGADFDAKKLGADLGAAPAMCFNYSKSNTEEFTSGVCRAMSSYRRSSSSQIDSSALKDISEVATA